MESIKRLKKEIVEKKSTRDVVETAINLSKKGKNTFWKMYRRKAPSEFSTW